MKCDDFTYGFEVEGFFADSLIQALKGLRLDFKGGADGSVNDRIMDKVKPLQDDFIDDGIEEIKIGIFKRRRDMLKVLSMIQPKKNHFFDRTCGLHLHIKPKKDNGSVGKLIEDMDFLKKIQQFAYENLCSHIKSRKSNTFCLTYRNFNHTLRDLRQQQKYRFIRHHSNYGTYEMRFFSPCEHKVENVKKFLAYFMRELNKVQPKKEGGVTLWASKDSTSVKIDMKLETGKKMKTMLKTYAIRAVEMDERDSERSIDVDFDSYCTGNSDCHCENCFDGCHYHDRCLEKRAIIGRCDCGACYSYRFSRGIR